MTIRLDSGADGKPQVFLTIQDDAGADLVYRYDPVAAAA
jgi:hypothetical protein